MPNELIHAVQEDHWSPVVWQVRAVTAFVEHGNGAVEFLCGHAPRCFLRAENLVGPLSQNILLCGCHVLHELILKNRPGD